MKYIFPFLVFILASVSLNAQTDAHIFGHAVDSLTQKHLANVNITLKNTTIGTITDATGHYIFKNLKEGTYILEASMVGYKPSAVKVEVVKDKTLEINFLLQEDILNLKETVVSSSRYSQDRTKAPVIVSSLSGNYIQKTQNVVLGEALNFCTGLRLENNCQNCGFSQVRINGMEGPYSQILINSRPIFSGLAGVYGLELIPTNMIEKIEVMRGGGSALYGSNAIAGTINLILKDPKQNDFMAGYDLYFVGKNGATDQNINFNASVVSQEYNAGLSLYGNVRDRQMYDANDDGFSEIAPMKNRVIGGRAYFRPSNRNKIALDFFSVNEERHGGNKQQEPHHLRDISESVKHDMKNVSLNFDQYVRESDLLSVFASGQFLDRDSYYGAEQSLNSYGNTKNNTFVFGSQYKFNFENSSLVFGFENKNDVLKDQKLGYPEFEAVPNPLFGTDPSEPEYIVETTYKKAVTIANQSLNTFGGFAQFEYKYNKFKTLLGARLERYAIEDKEGASGKKSGVVFSPRLNLMYDISENWQVRTGYSTGYRAPQIFDEDLHIETSGALQIINRNDPNLKQENSQSFTLSLDFNKNINNVFVNFLVEGFYTNLSNPFRNEIGDIDAQGVVVHTRVNAESGAVVKGFNLEAKVATSQKFSLNSGLTIQKSEFNDPQEDFGTKRFYRTPNVYGFLSADYKPSASFGTTLTTHYTGSMEVPYHLDYDDGSKTLRKSQPFFDLGLKCYYNAKIASGVSAQFSAGVKNLFNSYQNDFDKGIDRDPTYMYGPTQPRTFYIGVKFGKF